MFVKNAWYIAAMSDEIGRSLLQRWILDEPVVMYRTEDGGPVALRDVCPHRSMPLSMGELLGDQLRCGYHGLVFAPDGRCTHIPAQTHISERWCVKSFPIVEKWRWLWIWTGDPKAADETLISDFHWNEDPDWIPTGGHFEIKCHYQLLVDNLLDLSHLAFVHRTTIGTDAVAENPATVTREGDNVRIVRSMPSCPAPPLYVKLPRLWRRNRSQPGYCVLAAVPGADHVAFAAEGFERSRYGARIPRPERDHAWYQGDLPPFLGGVTQLRTKPGGDAVVSRGQREGVHGRCNSARGPADDA